MYHDMNVVKLFFDKQDDLDNRLRDVVVRSIKKLRSNFDNMPFTDLVKEQKSFLGSIVEFELKKEFKIKQGDDFDCQTEGVEWHIKFSITDKPMIPREAISGVCLLIGLHPVNHWQSAYVRARLFLAEPKYLTGGSNQDRKKGINKDGEKNTVLVSCPTTFIGEALR